MILKNNVFNNETLNIFTDASTESRGSVYYASSGSIAVIGDNIVDSRYEVLANSTNNRGELYAILLGIHQICKYKNNVKYINVYSDSEISVKGLTVWIFNWVNNMNNDGVLINSAKEPVANQDIINMIIGLILHNNISLKMYHVNSHSSGTENSILKFKDKFKRSNNIIEDIDISLMKAIIDYNNIVDNTTRENLRIQNDNNKVYPYTPPAYYCNINMDKYKMLLGLK